jgi:serine/threonine-protein kinase
VVPSRTPGRSHPTTGPATAGPSATTAPSRSPAKPAGGANPYTPKQVCGLGFAVIDQAALRDSGGVVRGRVYLLYNSVTGKNCTATIKATDLGIASAASAYLEVQGGSRSTDSGSFEYYAGPVRAKAAGVCVKWGGAVGGVSYDSPFEHCS